jgi:hypothetical protein
MGRCLQKDIGQRMKHNVRIRPEAENDLKEAFPWYEDKRLGLGYDFLLQVDAGIRFVERSPEVYSSEYRGIRISVSHLYNLRREKPYQNKRRH